ncbi:DUF2867 domain-containing protein, partial [Candidatus Marinamargulisbacteria bacterium SCGC AAA071-K20]
MTSPKSEMILITGSTGYVGSRLIQALANSKYSLVCTARNPDYIKNILPKNAISKRVDFTEVDTLADAFKDCHTAFYLMHSLGDKKGFEEKEALIARHFINAAKQSGVQRIIYLGGLFDEDTLKHSPHMRSRKNVGDILRSTPIPVIELRASVILGAGSTSFELIRSLVERLPIMVTPRWVSVKAQPIYIDDVISYLLQSIKLPLSSSEIIEIGGADVVSYQTIMQGYAQIRGLKRLMIPVPFLTPYISSLWLGLITPVYARVGRKLIDSITSESIITKKKGGKKFDIHPLGYYKSISKCLKSEDSNIKLMSWSYALSTSIKTPQQMGLRYRNRLIDIHKIDCPKSLKNPFKAVEEIGGKNGWYYLNFLWRLRGFIDLLVGGIGLRRGRRHPQDLAVGDTLDWWRVERCQPGQHLRLKAEMKLPGRAWLDFELITENNKKVIQQTVIFDPLGLSGLIYWYSLKPIHWILFRGMLN